jgi:hypothetical protein
MLRSDYQRTKDAWHVVAHPHLVLDSLGRDPVAANDIATLLQEIAGGEVRHLSDTQRLKRLADEILRLGGHLVLVRSAEFTEPKCGVGRVRKKHAPKETVKIGGINRPGSPKVVFLEKHTAAAYEALVKDARAAGFAEPLFAVVSGLRSQEKQAELFKKALAKYGSYAEARKWVAPPGHSAHATGCAIDFWMGFPCGKETNDKIKASAAYQWMVKNAKKHGFNPYEREGWHWEYNVGEAY